MIGSLDNKDIEALIEVRDPALKVILSLFIAFILLKYNKVKFVVDVVAVLVLHEVVILFWPHYFLVVLFFPPLLEVE